MAVIAHSIPETPGEAQERRKEEVVLFFNQNLGLELNPAQLTSDSVQKLELIKEAYLEDITKGVNIRMCRHLVRRVADVSLN